MPRCPNCEKFVSMEMGEPEIEVQLDDKILTTTTRLVKACTDCGEELEEAYVESDAIEVELPCGHSDIEANYEDDWSDNTRFEGSGRYMKTFYGVEYKIAIVCNECDTSEEVDMQAEEQAAYFDSLV